MLVHFGSFRFNFPFWSPRTPMEWLFSENSCGSVVLVPKLLQVVQVVEVALVGDAFPDDVGAVGLRGVGSVDAEEDVARVNEVFHEGDAQLVGSHHGEVELGIALGC